MGYAVTRGNEYDVQRLAREAPLVIQLKQIQTVV